MLARQSEETVCRLQDRMSDLTSELSALQKDLTKEKKRRGHLQEVLDNSERGQRDSSTASETTSNRNYRNAGIQITARAAVKGVRAQGLPAALFATDVPVEQDYAKAEQALEAVGTELNARKRQSLGDAFSPAPRTDRSVDHESPASAGSGRGAPLKRPPVRERGRSGGLAKIAAEVEVARTWRSFKPHSPASPP